MSQAPDIIERGLGDPSLSPQEVTFVGGKRATLEGEMGIFGNPFFLKQKE